MIKISETKRDLVALSEEHYRKVVDFIVSAITAIQYAPPKRPKTTKAIATYEAHKVIAIAWWQPFHDYLLADAGKCYPNLREIVLCPPRSFNDVYDKLESDYRISNYTDHIEKLFDYDKFSSGISCGALHYSAFDLVKSLRIPVCPYCNRHYISCLENGVKKATTGKQRRLRPPLDHFYPRSRYPVFGLSFFNLIPSCTFCNSSLKGQTQFKVDTHAHPYDRDFGDAAVFRFAPGAKTPITLTPADGVSPDQCVEQSKIEFELEKLYNDNHLDLAKELYDKKLEHSSAHFDSLVKILKTIKPLEADFYQFYFGNYFRADDFERRPLSKFTFDLVKQFGIMPRAGFTN